MLIIPFSYAIMNHIIGCLLLRLRQPTSPESLSSYLPTEEAIYGK